MFGSRFGLVAVPLFTSLLRASVIYVPAGADLQAAINTARPGDTIALAPGVTYIGNFTLTRKPGTGYVAITTAEPTDLPPDGQRITPSISANLPKIVTPNGSPAISVDSYANHYVLKGLEITSTGGVVCDVLISLTSYRAGPAFDIVLEQLYVHGNAGSGALRGIALNSASTTIRDSYISDFNSRGDLAQAVTGWSGPGPFTIENNYIESSGQNIVFGELAGVLPSGITIAHNVLMKPRATNVARWNYAPLLQLSNAQGVTIRGNTLESGAASNVYAFMIGGGHVETASVRDVVFSSNLVRSRGRAISIASSSEIEICENDLLTTGDVDEQSDLILIRGPVDHMTISNNDASTPASLIRAAGPPSYAFKLTGNTFQYGEAFITESALVPKPLEYYFPGSDISGNVFKGTYSGEELQITQRNEFPLAARRLGTRRIAGAAPAAPTVRVITPQYFGLHVTPAILNGRRTWPSVGFGSLRLLGDTINWNDIHLAPGRFDWSRIDGFLAKAKAQGISDIVYNLSKTPTWASSQPTRTGCADYFKRPGGCAPPDDLNADGTGTNRHWKEFVTAIATHAAGEGPGKIKYWEVWNEPNTPNMWVGTNAQLVRMAQDAWTIIKAIDPAAVLLTPPAAGGGEILGASWLGDYLAAGGGVWADVISFHGYIAASNMTNPEAINSGLSVILQARADYRLTDKPVWDSEASWSLNTRLPDPELQVAFVARYYLLQAANVSRFFWYQFDGGAEGTLIDLNTSRLTKGGTAYGELYKWLVGATPAGCSANGAVWTCRFTRPGGYEAVAVWDARTCSTSPCLTTPHVAGPAYTRIRDLSGNSGAITGPMDLGPVPVLLENQNTRD